MLSEELDLECEKLTTEWVHVEICRPMCNILNAFENKNFEIFNAVCDACDIESFKQQVIQNITTNLEELNKMNKTTRRGKFPASLLLYCFTSCSSFQLHALHRR